MKTEKFASEVMAMQWLVAQGYDVNSYHGANGSTWYAQNGILKAFLYHGNFEWIIELSETSEVLV